MDVCTIFLHIFNKKFWLQFICNKLICMVYAYLTPDFRKHISRELWYIFFVWSFSVMRFLRPLLKHLMSVRPSVRPSVRFLQSATPLIVTTQLIDVKLYNVLEIHCSCPQWFLDLGGGGRRMILQPATPKSGEDPGGGGALGAPP